MTFKKSLAQRTKSYLAKSGPKVIGPAKGVPETSKPFDPTQGLTPAQTAEGNATLAGKPKPSAGGQGSTVKPYVAPGPDQSWQDSTYNQGQSAITQGLSNLGGYLNQGAQGLGSDYGVSGGGDVTNFDPAHPPAFSIADNVDVTNPFSRAALLKRAHNQNQAGNTNSMAAAGQLYSGALQNAQNNEGFQYQGGKDSLLKDFASKYGDLYGQWSAGQTTATNQGLTNQSNAITAHANDPAAIPQTQNVAMKNSDAAGLRVTGVDPKTGAFIVVDSTGKRIAGAKVSLQGKRRIITVPKAGG